MAQSLHDYLTRLCRIGFAFATKSVSRGIGWWRLQAPGPEYGVLDVSVNTVLPCQGVMDPATGSVDTGAIPCRVRAA
jgi:hypothetical protein